MGVSAGSGVSVDEETTIGVVNEAAELGPHADTAKEKITINDQNEIILFIFIKSLSKLQVNGATAFFQLLDPGRDILYQVPAQIQFFEIPKLG